MEKVKKVFLAILPCILFFSTIVLDRITKNLALIHLQNSSYHVFSILDFVYVENYGAVFGLFSNHPINFAAVSIGSIVVIMILLRIFFTRIPWIPVSLIMGGAVGNIIDRYIYGFVVDFIKVGNFYVFNVADACITIGAALLFLYIILDSKLEETNQRQDSSG
jgi:signal peptidase II